MSSRTVRAVCVLRLTICLVLWSFVLGTPFVAVAAGQSSSLPYPDIYRSNGLPELPGATVTNVGRQTTSLHDGIRIQLTSATALAEVRDFYRKALLERGWQEPPPSAAVEATKASPLLAMITMTNGRLVYSLIILKSRDSTGTQVTITVRER